MVKLLIAEIGRIANGRNPNGKIANCRNADGRNANGKISNCRKANAKLPIVEI
jgi:hypothetical protein